MEVVWISQPPYICFTYMAHSPSSRKAVALNQAPDLEAELKRTVALR